MSPYARQLMIVIALGFVIASLNGCISVDTGVRLRRDVLREETLIKAKKRTNAKVLLVDVSGLITMQGRSSFFGGYRPHAVEQMRAVLDRARDDRNVKALLLRISSPGGEVTATDALYREIERFKADRNVKVVAEMMEVTASGGYYVACTADLIMAHPTSVTGSIGTIANTMNVAGLMEKIGVGHESIKSGQNKDMGSPFRPMTAEERAIFQSIIDTSYNRFVDIVAAGRPDLSRDEVLTLADGRIYAAAQAQDAGLVDEIGYLDDAFERAKQLAELRDASLVAYTFHPRRSPNVYSPMASVKSEPIPVGSAFGAELAAYAEILSASLAGPVLYVWPGGLGALTGN